MCEHGWDECPGRSCRCERPASPETLLQGDVTLRRAQRDANTLTRGLSRVVVATGAPTVVDYTGRVPDMGCMFPPAEEERGLTRYPPRPPIELGRLAAVVAAVDLTSRGVVRWWARELLAYGPDDEAAERVLGRIVAHVDR